MTIAGALAGGAGYLAAKVAGDVRTDDELRAIASVCAECSKMQRHRASGIERLVGQGRCGWCGKPELSSTPQDRQDGTCGCLVLAECEPERAHVTVNGVPMRAQGKPEVASRSCGLGKW